MTEDYTAKMLAIHVNKKNMKKEDYQEFERWVKENEPQAYEQYMNNKEKLDTDHYNQRHELNIRFMTQDKIKELNGMDCYVPIRLQSFLTKPYYDQASEDVKKQLYDSYMLSRTLDYPSEYMNIDLLWWINEHKEFQELIR